MEERSISDEGLNSYLEFIDWYVRIHCHKHIHCFVNICRCSGVFLNPCLTL